MRWPWFVAIMIVFVVGGGGARAADAKALDKARTAARSAEKELTARLETSAAVAVAAGDLARAEVLYRRLVQLTPDSAKYVLELADVLLAAEAFDALDALLDELSRRSGAVPRCSWLRALAAEAQGDEKRFNELCSSALDAASPQQTLHSAEWFERRGHVTLARRLRLALAQGAGEEAGMANLLLGQHAWDRGRYDEALPFYERAERLLKGQKLSVRGPGGEELGLRLTVCEAARDAAEGRDAQAVSALRRLLTERSDSLEAAALLTNLLRRRNDHEEADAVADGTIAALSVPIERGDRRAHDCNAVAWFMALTDTDLEEAERLSRLSLDMDVGNPAYLDTLAEIAFRRGDSSRAVQLIRDALVQRPENRAYFEAQLGKFQHALERPKQSAE